MTPKSAAPTEAPDIENKPTPEQEEAAANLFEAAMLGRTPMDSRRDIARILATREDERANVIAEFREKLEDESADNEINKRERLNAESLIAEIRAQTPAGWNNYWMKRAEKAEALNAQVAAEAVRPWREAVEKAVKDCPGYGCTDGVVWHTDDLGHTTGATSDCDQCAPLHALLSSKPAEPDDERKNCKACLSGWICGLHAPDPGAELAPPLIRAVTEAIEQADKNWTGLRVLCLAKAAKDAVNAWLEPHFKAMDSTVDAIRKKEAGAPESGREP